MSQMGCFVVCGRSQGVHGRNHKTSRVQVHVALPLLYALVGRIRALVFPQPHMRAIWVSTSLLVAVRSPLRGKEQRAHLFEQGAFEALPKSTRVPVASCSKEEPSLNIWSPDLEHSAHIHEALESCGCMDHWGISSWNVYQHFACYHKN